jgi:hypothetical protein
VLVSTLTASAGSKAQDSCFDYVKNMLSLSVYCFLY